MYIYIYVYMFVHNGTCCFISISRIHTRLKQPQTELACAEQ